MKRSFWKAKKVLVTGNTGFKGSWLSLWLKMLGAEVAGYSLSPPTKPNLFEAARINKELITVNGDLRDYASLKSVISWHKPQIIIHMAAQSLVRYSYSNPVETFSTNVMGTVNLLEAVRETGVVRSVVVVTTDKCYENDDKAKPNRGYGEEDPLGGYDPYSGSKACAELAVAAYLKSYFNPERFREHGVALASARAGNVIGGGDWSSDRLIPDCIKAIGDKRTIVVRHPNAVRPWQHVLEPLYGYLLLAQRLYEEGPGFSGPWNFGDDGENAKPVRWIVERITALMEDNAGWIIDRAQNPHEFKHLRLDSTKAKTKLNWRPIWDISVTLEKTAGWFKAYFNGEEMRDFTSRQIEDYENNLKKELYEVPIL